MVKSVTEVITMSMLLSGTEGFFLLTCGTGPLDGLGSLCIWGALFRVPPYLQTTVNSEKGCFQFCDKN